MCVYTRGISGSTIVFFSKVLKTLAYQLIQVFIFTDQAPTRLLIEVENSKGFTSILSSSRGERENNILY